MPSPQRCDMGLIDPAQIAAWPQVKLGSKQFHLSTQLAA